MIPFNRKLQIIVSLILYLLFMDSCSEGVKHPENINKNIIFNKSIVLVKPILVGPDVSFIPKDDISLYAINLSNKDIKVSDKKILLYENDGNNFVPISNLTEGPFGGHTNIPAKNEFNQNGRLLLDVVPDISGKMPVTIRVYVLGTLKDKFWEEKEVGAFMDIDIK